MDSKTISNGILRALATVTGILLLLYFLYQIQSVIIYLVIAGILSLVARPLLKIFNERLKLPNIVSVIIVMAIFLLALIGIISMTRPEKPAKDLIRPAVYIAVSDKEGNGSSSGQAFKHTG